MKDLNLYILTWNCGRSLIQPEVFAQHLFDGWEVQPAASHTGLPDLIVINLQEIAPISYAFLGASFTKAYFDRFRQAVNIATKKDGEDVQYFNILSRNAGLTGLMLFVRDELVENISDLKIADVAVGNSELGNKGAVGARMDWKLDEGDELSCLTFVSAHLAPFEEEVERRNEDFRQIAANLVFADVDAREWRKSGGQDENVPLLHDGNGGEGTAKSKGMYADDTLLFFSGDLNYRTGLTKPARDDYKLFPQPCKDPNRPEHYSHLLEKDQLSQQLEAGKTLNGLSEQPIHFAPTYKYHNPPGKDVVLDEDVDKWTWAEHRWPSWCDRIFFSTTDETKIKPGKYTSLPLFATSDHRPVALSALVPLKALSRSDLAAKAPTKINPDWKARHDFGKRKEMVVGLLSYLSLTWEGNGMLLGTFLVIMSGWWFSKTTG